MRRGTQQYHRGYANEPVVSTIGQMSKTGLGMFAQSATARTGADRSVLKVDDSSDWKSSSQVRCKNNGSQSLIVVLPQSAGKLIWPRHENLPPVIAAANSLLYNGGDSGTIQPVDRPQWQYP